MLRLKQALHDCGIPQKKVVEATGFGKTQVSLTLSTGKLPADEDRFKDGVVQLVKEATLLGSWLANRSMNVERLFDAITPPASGHPPLDKGGAGGVIDLETQLYALAGRACINGGLSSGTALRLIKALHFISLTISPILAANAAAFLEGSTCDSGCKP